jgi:hypothetical protein
VRKCDPAAERKAHDVGLLVAQVPDQGGDVVGHGLETHRPVDGRRPAVRLKVYADDLAAGSQRRHGRAEHLGRPEAAMEQDQRLAGAVDLVAELDAVHRRQRRRRDAG